MAESTTSFEAVPTELALAEPTTLVLLDPTVEDGGSALDLLDDRDTHITLVLLLWDKSSFAIRRFAEAENISVSQAADIYLDQVIARVQGPDRKIERAVLNASNATLELAMLERTYPTRRVLRPQSTMQAPTANLARLTIRDQIAAKLGPTMAALLVKSALSGKIPVAELARLEELGTLLNVKEGSKLIGHDTDGRMACVVVDGALSVERGTEKLAQLGPGEFAGEISLLAGMRYNADVFASVDTVVLIFDEIPFSALLEACPTLARHVMRTSVQRLVA